MVDSITNVENANTEAPDFTRMDQLDRAAEIFLNNIMALIKLRKKGATKASILPRDIFRCILEYQFPKVLCWRYSDPFGGLIDGKQDRHFPAIDKLDFNN